jgi:glyoxylase-like metal-dependent hydrolase (beta-lactamase superfamily II)
MSLARTGLTRRGALGAGAGLLAAPALLGAAWPARADAPMLGPSRPTHYRFGLGAFEVTMLLDGARQLDGPYPIFGENQDPDEVAAYAEENFLPGDRMEISFAPVLVNTGTDLVLFDAGNAAGGQPDVGNLAGRLEAAGYSADQIDILVVTHCHPDHIGGLMTDGQPSFPNARIAIGQVEYDWWTSDAPIGTPREGLVGLIQSNVVPLADNTTFLDDGDDVVSGITAMAAFGHSPGHMAFHIESEGRRFLIFADATNHYVMSLQRPDWHVVFDQDKDMAIESRRRILDMLAGERIPAAGYHMPFPAVGYVERTDESYRWVPASYQLNL